MFVEGLMSSIESEVEWQRSAFSLVVGAEEEIMGGAVLPGE